MIHNFLIPMTHTTPIHQNAPPKHKIIQCKDRPKMRHLSTYDLSSMCNKYIKNLAPHFTQASAFLSPYISSDTRPWHLKVAFCF